MASDELPPTYAEAFPSLGAPRSAGQAQQQQLPRRPAIQTQSVQINFDIPYEEQRHKVAGPDAAFASSKTGDFLAEIERSTGVKIDVTTKRDKSITVSIRGKKDQVQEAKNKVLRELQTQASLPVQIPKDHHRFVMGKGGERVKEIQEKYGVRIQIPKADDPSDIITVIGTTDNCRKAAADIKAISDERAKSDSQAVPVLKVYHPLIAGHNNTTIKRIEEQTGTRIHVPPPAVKKDEINVQGTKEGVAAAVRELEIIYNEKRATCRELTAQVKKSQHRFVIGPKGTHLQEIMERFGVVVEVPPTDSESDTIILRGDQRQLAHALTLVYEKANSITMVTITIPAWLHKHVIGPKGANLKSINENYPKVHVQFKEDSDVVEIEGPPAEVEIVKNSLVQLGAELAAKMTYAIVKCDPKFHRHIIGSKGATIKAIKDETGAQINIPPDESKSDEIRIEGTPEAVRAAKARLETLINRLANERTVDVKIPQQWHSLLIGQKGASLRELTSKYPSVSINFPQKNEVSDMVNLRGDKNEVEAVEKQLKQLLKKVEAENYELEVPIFRQVHSLIIGKGGATITKIREETHTRVNVPGPDDPKDTITVVGTEENCKKAQQMMLEIQDQVAKIVSKEVNVPAKAQAFVQGPHGRVATSLSEEFGVQITFPTGKGKGADIVTVRGPAEAVDKAVEQIKKIAGGDADSQYTEDMKVPARYHKFLIGKGGAALAKLVADTGVARILFPKVKPGAASKAKAKENGKDGPAAAAGAAGGKAAKDGAKAEEKGGKSKKKGAGGDGAAAAAVEEPKPAASSAAGAAASGGAGKEDPDVITLIGKKEACAKARAQIEARMKELDSVVEEVIEVDPKLHKSLVGKSGAFLKSLAEEFGDVNVVVPKAPAEGEAASKKVTVKGPKDSVAGAIEKIKEHLDYVERSTSKTMVVPATSIATILGTKGATIQQLSATHNVNIKIPERDTRKEGETEVTLTITGLPEHIAEAEAAIKELLPVSEEYPLPAALHRFIIGKKGAGISKMQDDYSVRFDIPRPEENKDVIIIRGKKENIARARKHLEDRQPEFREALLRNHQLEVKVDPKYHKLLIGSGGATVNGLRQKYDVQLDFPREKGEQAPDVIVLTGYAEKCEACKQEILRLVEEFASQITKTVDIHHTVHGRIIGAKGAGVKKLQEEFKVRINFPSDKQSNSLEVSGSAEGVDACIVRLKQIEEEHADDIHDYESMQQYIKPSRQEEGSRSTSSAPFMVRDAPWQNASEQAGAFPSLPAAPAAAAASAAAAAAPAAAADGQAKNLSGAWARR